MSGCNCCDEPPCSAPYFLLETVSVSKGKCGVAYGSEIPASVDDVWPVYKKITEGYGIREYSRDMAGNCNYTDTCIPHVRTEHHTCNYDNGIVTYSLDTTKTTTTNSACNETVTYSGTSTSHTDAFGIVCDCTSTQNSDGSWTGTLTGDPPCPSGTTNSECGDCTSVGSNTYTDNTTPAPTDPAVKVEYTTAELISYVESIVPAYTGIYNGPIYPVQVATRNLGPYKQGYSISRSNCVIAFQPTGTCYLKVWYEVRFVAEGDDFDDYSVVNSYTFEWALFGVGYCIPDPTKSVLAIENRILSDPFEIIEPDTDGTLYLAMTKYSCLPSYEPDISDPGNPQPNGFPDPAWQPTP